MLQRVKKIFDSLGPGFIMVAVILGPGSITTSTKIGATLGFNFLWVILIAAVSMMVFTNMSTRFGILHSQTMLGMISEKYGKWFAAVIGISTFLASLSFQFGNNLGVGMGMETITGIDAKFWPLLFTLLAILLIFFAKNLYKTLEKLMMAMVMIMITAFIINLIFIKPDLVETAKGFIPKPFDMKYFGEFTAIVGTTFVVHSALYQSYLVQNKGWELKDINKGIRDSNLGVFLLALMSILVVVTAAATLKPMGVNINSASDMAIQLEVLLGSYAKYIFAFGFISAAFSSLLVNAVIGGGLLADGLGLGKTMDEKIPKVFTILILLVGMVIAIYVSSYGGNAVYSLIIAQASSMLVAPLTAIGMLLLMNRKDVMGKYKNKLHQNILGFIGFVFIIILVYIMYSKLIGNFTSL